jgi:hypothetical protein
MIRSIRSILTAFFSHIDHSHGSHGSNRGHDSKRGLRCIPRHKHIAPQRWGVGGAHIQILFARQPTWSQWSPLWQNRNPRSFCGADRPLVDDRWLRGAARGVFGNSFHSVHPHTTHRTPLCSRHAAIRCRDQDASLFSLFPLFPPAPVIGDLGVV